MSLKNKKISIIGGGFSGLTLAYELNRLGFDVSIFEKKTWGGLISTIERPEMPVETAANAFLNSEKLQEISQNINCPLFHRKEIAKKRFIYRGKPLRWPVGFISTVKLIYIALRYIILRSEEIKPRPLESVEKYILRILNAEVLDYLVSPALQGIYAGDVRQLSATLLVKPIFLEKKKNNVKLGSVSPKHGMGEFVSQLKAYLQKKGVKFDLQEIQTRDQMTGITVLAIPPWEIAKIFDPQWSQVNVLSLVRATVSFQNPNHKINGFGILFPEVEKFNALGVLSNTDIFENRGSIYNESWILGGARNAQYIQLSDADILQKISEDRKKIFGIEDQIKDFHIVRWPRALTHYDLAHEDFLSKYRFENNYDIYFTGNYLGQLGLSRILDQNTQLAQKLKEKYA